MRGAAAGRWPLTWNHTYTRTHTHTHTRTQKNACLPQPLSPRLQHAHTHIHTQTCAVEVWRLNSTLIFAYLEDLRRPYFGEPLDVSPLRLAAAALLGLLCGFAATAAVLVLGVLRLPFVMAR